MYTEEKQPTQPERGTTARKSKINAVDMRPAQPSSETGLELCVTGKKWND